mgnify:FL=1
MVLAVLHAEIFFLVELMLNKILNIDLMANMKQQTRD